MSEEPSKPSREPGGHAEPQSHEVWTPEGRAQRKHYYGSSLLCVSNGKLDLSVTHTQQRRAFKLNIVLDGFGCLPSSDRFTMLLS